ncbi:MAG: SsrA-binding protein SmpB [Candidatus Dasytiphilus stammeri]
MKKKIINSNNIIISINKQVKNQYFVEEILEAGLILQGWEVKSLRSGKVDISSSYVYLHDNNAYLFSAHFQPLLSSSPNLMLDPLRNRNLLLKKKEYNYLYEKVKRQGYTLIAYSLYWKNNWCKLQIALAKGKKKYDKRALIKEREWLIKKNRILKQEKRDILKNKV